MSDRARYIGRDHPLELLGLLVTFACLLGALGIGVYEIVHWLRYAAWVSMPVSLVTDALGVSRPNASWAGVQVVLGWLLALPLWAALLVLSWAGIGLHEIGTRMRRAA